MDQFQLQKVCNGPISILKMKERKLTMLNKAINNSISTQINKNIRERAGERGANLNEHKSTEKCKNPSCKRIEKEAEVRNL